MCQEVGGLQPPLVTATGDDGSFLGLSEASISHFSFSHHSWTRGEYGLVSGPYDVTVANSSKKVCVHLHPLEATAYSLLVPVSLLKNYLRLLDQNECIVVYGPPDSGKCSLVHQLATLWSGSDPVTTVDFGNGTGRLDRVHKALDASPLVVVQRVPRAQWPSLRPLLQNGLPSRRVLVSLDSWRRPCGALEEGVLWIQLRPDREPLSAALPRSLMKELASHYLCLFSRCNFKVVAALQWVCALWSQLAVTLMALGFSAPLHGPHLFTRAMQDISNPRDVFKAIEVLWNSLLSCEILHEVRSVWQGSKVGSEIEEAKVADMALHVVLQRAMVPHLPLSASDTQAFLSSLNGGQTIPFEGLPRPRPTDLPLRRAHSASSPSPTSPEWNEASLSKILGLSPMDYV